LIRAVDLSKVVHVNVGEIRNGAEFDLHGRNGRIIEGAGRDIAFSQGNFRFQGFGVKLRSFRCPQIQGRTRRSCLSLTVNETKKSKILFPQISD
jgi:hypothetical protein